MKTRAGSQPMLPFADETPSAPEVPAGNGVDRVPAPKVLASSTHTTARSWLAAALPEIGLLAAAVLVLGLWIGQAPLLDPDEARYAAASREMLDRGDLVVPHYNGIERLNKPALFYWLQTASFRLAGPSETAARLPSVGAALLAALVVYGFARRIGGRRAALRAAAILMSCPLFVMVGKIGITDMTLCLFVTAALVSWYRYLEGIGHARLNWLTTSLALGLAFFVKGPVGVVLSCLVIGVFLAARGEWKRMWNWKPFVAGVALASAVVLPWGCLLVYRLGREAGGAAAFAAPDIVASAGIDVPAEAHEDSRTAAMGGSPSPRWPAPGAPPSLPQTLLLGIGRIGALLRRETIERAVTGLEHPRSPMFYLPAMMVVFLPWSFYLPLALGSAASRLRARDPAVLFLAIWFAVVLIVFSLVKGKLVTYILPAAPPMALFLALLWPCRTADRAREKNSRIEIAEKSDGVVRPPEIGGGRAGPRVVSVRGAARSAESIAHRAGWPFGGALLTAGALVVLIGSALAGRPSWLAPYRFEVSAFAILVALAGIVPILLRRPNLSTYTVAGAMMLAIAVLPAHAGRTISEKRSLRRVASETMGPDRTWTRVIAYQLPRPSLVYYGHRTIEMAGSLHELRRLIERDALVFMEERRFQDMPAAWQDAFRTVATQDEILALSPIAPLPDQTSQ